MRLLPTTLTSPPQAPVLSVRDREARSTEPDAWGVLMKAAQNGHGGAYRRLLRFRSRSRH